MLQIKSRHFYHPERSHTLALSPVSDDESDELIRAIDDSHEEPWRLDPTPDVGSLTNFWNDVEHDIQRDPEWVNFSDDDE